MVLMQQLAAQAAPGRAARQTDRQEALPPGAQLQPAQALPTLHILDIQYLLLPRYAQVARVVAKAAAAGAAGAAAGAGEQGMVGEGGQGADCRPLEETAELAGTADAS